VRFQGPEPRQNLIKSNSYDELWPRFGAVRPGSDFGLKSKIGAEMAKRRKIKEKIDGLGADDIRKIRTAIRQVWSWSYPRRLCVERATGKDGFPRCEKCKKKVPKVYPDHIQNVGEVDAGFIKRMFVSSQFLQALCRSCHGKKTRAERAQSKKAKAKTTKIPRKHKTAIADFF